MPSQIILKHNIVKIYFCFFFFSLMWQQQHQAGNLLDQYSHCYVEKQYKAIREQPRDCGF